MTDETDVTYNIVPLLHDSGNRWQIDCLNKESFLYIPFKIILGFQHDQKMLLNITVVLL